MLYEVGWDETEILGSGSIYHTYWKGTDESEAFKKFNTYGMTFLKRTTRIDGKLCTEFYNSFTKRWT